MPSENWRNASEHLAASPSQARLIQMFDHLDHGNGVEAFDPFVAKDQ